MRKLLGGTLVLALASLLSAAPQKPPAEGSQPPPKQTAKKSNKRKPEKTHTQTGEKNNKSGKPDTKPSGK